MNIRPQHILGPDHLEPDQPNHGYSYWKLSEKCRFTYDVFPQHPDFFSIEKKSEVYAWIEP